MLLLAMAEKVIIQFESEDFYCAVVNQILYTVDSKVAGIARTKSQAQNLLGKVARGEIKPDLAIIDSMLENNHEEGAIIAAKLKELSPKTKIIAYTIIEEQPWADYVAIKSNRIPAQTLTRGLSELIGLTIDPSDDAKRYNSDT